MGTPNPAVDHSFASHSPLKLIDGPSLTLNPRRVPTFAPRSRDGEVDTESAEGKRKAQYTVVASPALEKGAWGQLCVSCRLVRPLRAKHCAVNDRCVEVFDHYCPWVGNTVAKGNRHYFMYLLFAVAGALVSSCWGHVREGLHHVGHPCFAPRVPPCPHSAFCCTFACASMGRDRHSPWVPWCSWALVTLSSRLDRSSWRH